MTDKPQPEAREFTMSQYASKDDMIGAMRKRIAELESELEAIGAGGMQALSAAPAGWKLVPEDATEEMVRATDKVNFANADTDGTMHNVWNVMLAATPTPPAEQQAATKAAPGEQNTVPAEWLEQAYREGWAACRDAETIGEEAEDWAFGNSTANSRMIDAQQAAPKQEAQEPVAWQGVHDQTDLYYTKPLQADVRPLYAAPQPAPECHHRPPCAECAARARLGEQT